MNTKKINMTTTTISAREVYIRRLYKELSRASIIGAHRRMESEKRAKTHAQSSYKAITKEICPRDYTLVISPTPSYLLSSKQGLNPKQRLAFDLKRAAEVGQQKRVKYQSIPYHFDGNLLLHNLRYQYQAR